MLDHIGTTVLSSVKFLMKDIVVQAGLSRVQVPFQIEFASLQIKQLMKQFQVKMFLHVVEKISVASLIALLVILPDPGGCGKAKESSQVVFIKVLVACHTRLHRVLISI